jgi:hypothetical protein
MATFLAPSGRIDPAAPTKEPSMKRFFLALSIPAICLVAAATPAAAKKDPTKITCEEFAAQSPEGRARVTAFLDGYSKRGKKVEEVGEVDVQRELDVLVVSCKEEPKATFWDKVKMKLPGGKKRVKPVAMTCEEFLALGTDVQPEVAYWLHGYNRKTKTDVEAAGEVDLETDTAVLIQACKPTPKAPLWDRIKEKF